MSIVRPRRPARPAPIGSRELPLHQQVQRLDVERRDLPDVREGLDPEGAGHEREVDVPGIDVRELGLGVLRGDDVDLDAARLHLARERARDHERVVPSSPAVSVTRLAAGGSLRAASHRLAASARKPQRECESPESPAASGVRSPVPFRAVVCLARPAHARILSRGFTRERRS